MEFSVIFNSCKCTFTKFYYTVATQFYCILLTVAKERLLFYYYLWQLLKRTSKKIVPWSLHLKETNDDNSFVSKGTPIFFTAEISIARQ